MFDEVGTVSIGRHAHQTIGTRILGQRGIKNREGATGLPYRNRI